MIYYLKSTERTWNIVGLPSNPAEKCEIQFKISNVSDQSEVFCSKICKALDVLFSPGCVLCWESITEMNDFINATKQHLNFRVKKHSIVLPACVTMLLQGNGPLSPELFHFALRSNGYTPEDIQKIKGINTTS